MNIKRPSIIFAISTIAGVLLAYHKILTIDKIIILSIVFILFIILFCKKIIKVDMIIAIIIIIAIFSMRFNFVEKYYNNTNNIIENKINKNSIIKGEVYGTGKSTNSYYIDVKNSKLVDDTIIGNIRCYYNPIGIDQNINDIKIGQMVQFSGKAFLFEKASNTGQFDSENYYRSIGFNCSFYANKINITNYKYNIFLQTLEDIKLKIKSNIYTIFTKENAGIFTCMVTGDRSGISIEKKKMYQENGIAHILAISGLHLSILGLAIFEFLRKRMKLKYAALIVSVFILLYGIFINSGVTSLRAILMLYARFASLWLKRSYDSKNILYLLFIIFVLINPYNLFNVGFQFSYLAIFSLNIKFKITNNIKLPNVIILTLLLLPITTYNYFVYPVYSILLNLIVIPLMTFVLLFGIIGVGISFINIALGKFTVGIVHVIFLIYEKLCFLIEKLPYHKYIFGKPSLKTIILFYVILFIIYYVNTNFLINKKNIISKYKILVNLFSIVMVFVSIFIMTYKPHNIFKVTSLSIGQGDGFVIDDKGKIITIDGGSTSNIDCGEYILSTYFLANKITNIDKSYISHIDSDHTNGIEYLITSGEDIKINEVVLPYNAKIDPKYNNFKKILKDSNIKYSYLSRGENDIIDEKLNFYCLNPTDNLLNENIDVNENSLVLKMNYDGKSMLFTGDINKEIEKELFLNKKLNPYLKSDILKVAHHGSSSSSLVDFVRSVSPDIAIISYGYKNSYGHPHKKTLKTLKNEKIRVFDTVHDGMIDIYFDKNIQIRPFFYGK